ncbi:hypothetical protein QBZ16_003581 [Prototheca wickerhamii]|uniref:Uncharacterized protein n=1 Tax=Prototheca wickerhamii TaxID=3111 RepID=A0AAD9IHT2_PROWI|nr:hypothetical protein QBZ16_003581 [Prototheca wickerhamii]
MPGLEAGSYQPRLEVPLGLRANEEVFVCRYTGQIFREYEDYVKQITAYNQRQWTDRYQGTKGLTFEEAASTEFPVQSILDQFPAIYEEGALRAVHFSTQPLDELCVSLKKHLQLRLYPGEPVLATIEGGGVAPCMVQRSAPSATGSPPGEYEIAWLAATGVPDRAPQPRARTAAPAPGAEPDGPRDPGAAAPVAAGRRAVAPAGWRRAGVWEVLPHFVAKHRLAERPPPELEAALREAAEAEAARAASGAASQVESDAALARAVAVAEGLLPGTADASGGLLPEDEDDEYRPGAGGAAGAAGAAAVAGPHPPQSTAAAAAARKPAAAAKRKSAPDAAGTPLAGGAPAKQGTVGPGTPDVAPGSAPTPAASCAPAPPRTVDGIAALQASAALMHESLEDAARRIQPGSIKAAVFQVLREAGAEGLTIQDAAQRIQDTGLRAWEDPKAARNSVASTCGHDAAFLRVGPGRFALRALVPNSAGAELAAAEAVVAACCGGAEGDGSVLDGPASAAFPSPLAAQDKALALVEAQLLDAARKLRDERSKPRTEHNVFKCPRCHRGTHPDGSPLLLCDTCPRAYHLSCLGGAGEGEAPPMGWHELPTGDWACPKCVEATQTALRRVLDLDARRKEALERAQAREREAEDRLLKRLLAKEERDRRRGAPGAGAAGGGEDGSPAPAAAGAAAAAKKAPLDDWDLLEEEREHLLLLEARAAELGQSCDAGDEGVKKEEGVKDEAPESALIKLEKAEPGTTDVAASATDGGSVPPPQPTSHAARLAETTEAIAKLRLLIEGPSAPVVFLENERDRQALERALETSQFLQLYGAACEAESPDAPALLTRARWPLDGEGLGALYHQLTLCCLIEQQNQDPPMKARARRWARVLTPNTWPEILRRYLLATRGRRRERPRREEEDEEEGDEDEDDDASTGRAAARPGSALDGEVDEQEVGGEEANTAESDAALDPLALADDAAALLAARELARGAWHGLRPELHLRLLGALCYDIAQGYALRADINARLQESIRLQTEARARRPDEEELEEEEDPDDGDDEGPGTTDGPASALEQAQARWAAREQAFYAELQERASRAEPLGYDRHHRRYWWLAAAPGVVLVDFPEGEARPLGALRSRAEAGARGYALREHERPPLRDKRMAFRTVEELEAAQARAALQEARERVDSLLVETGEVGCELDADAKALRKELRAAYEAPETLLRFLLDLERVYAVAGEGLPPGASDKEISALLREESASDEAPGAADVEMADVVPGEAVKADTPPTTTTTPPIEPEGSAAPEDSAAQDASAGNSAAVSYSAAAALALAARLAGPGQACYCALLLCDRAGPMLQRFITLAEEAAKWEAAEKERLRLERAEAAAASRRRAEEESAALLSPTRPMMIRTGKAKTDDGVRVVVADCRWGYQCSVCLLAGDLLCCEHPSGCNVSAHVECSGGAQAFPRGPWICSNHDDRDMKTRIRRKRGANPHAPGAGAGGGGDDDSEATVSEGDDGDDDDDDSGGYSGKKRGGKRARAR